MNDAPAHLHGYSIPDGLFIIGEWFPEWYIKNVSHSILWSRLNPAMLWTAVAVRRYFDAPMQINTWAFGGSFQYRGWRPHDCAEGAKWSDHKFGCAFDFDLRGVPSVDVRAHLRANPDHWIWQYVTVAEDFPGMSWVHLGFRNYDRAKHGILWVTG